MPTQSFIRSILEIENAFDPTGPFTMCAAQFIRIFMQNGIYDESITCLSLFMFLKRCRRDGVPYIYSVQQPHLFPHASCAHVQFASMDHKHDARSSQQGWRSCSVGLERGGW